MGGAGGEAAGPSGPAAALPGLNEAYAVSLGQPALVVHINTTEEEERRFRAYWSLWGDHLPKIVIATVPFHLPR